MQFSPTKKKKKSYYLGQQFCLRTKCPAWVKIQYHLLSSEPGRLASFQSTSLPTYPAHTLSAVYNEDIMRNGIKDFAKVESTAFPLVHQVSHLIVEGYQVGQA